MSYAVPNDSKRSRGRAQRLSTYDSLLSFIEDENCHRIVIIGIRNSGKTYLANKLSEDLKDFRVFRADRYLDLPYVEQLYALYDDVEKHEGNWIVEGIQGYRFIRRAPAEWVDLVIHMGVDKRIPADYLPVAKGLYTIWQDCLKKIKCPIVEYDYDVLDSGV